LRRAQAVNGAYIQRFLSTYFARNTHLLGEAVALFFLGVLYPEMRGAARWRETGWRTILEEMKFQVREDGLYFEQSTYYHVYALDFFLHARLLAANNEVRIPSEFDERLRKMLEALAALTAGGPAPRLGDDDGGRLFDPIRNRAAHMKDPLAVGAAVFADAGWGCAPTEESVWICGDAASSRETSSAAHSASFPDSGVYISVIPELSKWKLTADTGPMGQGNGGHGHADLLSVQVSCAAGEVLIDPGTGSYMNPRLRERFRATSMHNTLEVDGESQAVPVAPFKWAALPDFRVEQWTVSEKADYLRASHDGYLRLAEPVLHRRHVLRGPGFWLVLDQAMGDGAHDLALHWQVAARANVEPIDERTERLELGKYHLLVCGEENGWQRFVEESWASPVYGKTAPSRQIVFRNSSILPDEMATLLTPWAESCSLKRRVEGNSTIFEIQIDEHITRVEMDNESLRILKDAGQAPYVEIPLEGPR
jgi:hypothetical protein